MYKINVELMSGETVVLNGYDSFAIARESAKTIAKTGLSYDQHPHFIVIPALQIVKLVVEEDNNAAP